MPGSKDAFGQILNFAHDKFHFSFYTVNRSYYLINKTSNDQKECKATVKNAARK